MQCVAVCEGAMNEEQMAHGAHIVGVLNDHRYMQCAAVCCSVLQCVAVCVGAMNGKQMAHEALIVGVLHDHRYMQCVAV